MHPSVLFKESGLRTGIDTFEVFDNDLKEKMMNVHPMNFIKTRLTLPLYRVLVSYETAKGNAKESEKYMVMDSNIENGEEEYYSEAWAEMLVGDYERDHGMSNAKILSMEHIADVVLPIG